MRQEALEVSNPASQVTARLFFLHFFPVSFHRMKCQAKILSRKMFLYQWFKCPHWHVSLKLILHFQMPLKMSVHTLPDHSFWCRYQKLWSGIFLNMHSLKKAFICLQNISTKRSNSMLQSSVHLFHQQSYNTPRTTSRQTNFLRTDKLTFNWKFQNIFSTLTLICTFSCSLTWL